MLDPLLLKIEHALFEIKNGAPRTRHVAMLVLRYPYALAHDIAQGQLTLRAMSLVYTTLLSIVPLFALSFSVLKGLGYHRDLEPVLYQFLEPMGDKGYEITSQIMGFVENVRGGVLGSLGFMFLLYTAISMVQKVEESFNMVWRVQKPRAFGRRISEYLSVLLIGPAVIIAALGLMTTLTNYKVVQDISHVKVFGTMLLWIGRAVPYAMVAGVFTFLYAFIPNTKVKLRAAAVGGIVAGVLWAGSGALFASFVSGTNNTVLIYAGFAIVILALTWLYISWLILLIGAQLAFYVQYPQNLQPGSNIVNLSASLSERLALSVMYLLAEDFSKADRRVHYTESMLADRLYIAGATLAPVIDDLENAGLIVATEKDRLLPGRDLEEIKLTEILDAVRIGRKDRAVKQIRSVPSADAVAAVATSALHASIQDKTLKQLITQPPVKTQQN